jgi:hypothetical protein
MRFIKTSARSRPAVSLVLLDWSVRESFHLLHYLSRQTASRDSFEVILVEYFSSVSEAAGTYADQIDTWIVLDMPETVYYHKHLMYNVGIEFARGDVIMIGDSDAMVRETFIESIIRAFKSDPDIVFHIDQFRNIRRDYYPFNFPGFEEVLGPECINNVDGKTAGVVEPLDPLHARNYGACMCARRDDLIAVGGADEHIDYLGHICGPYDMTFRLVNMGRREVWSPDEFSYHTWHPGQAGVDNYLGPHDGRHMSTTALEALLTGRVLPLVENAAIRARRLGRPLPPEEAAARIVRDNAARDWDHALLDGRLIPPCPVDSRLPIGKHLGAAIFQDGLTFHVGPSLIADPPPRTAENLPSAAAARRAVEEMTPPPVLSRARRLSRLGSGIQLAMRVLNKLRRPPSWRTLRNLQARRREEAPQQSALSQWAASTDLANLAAQVLTAPPAAAPPVVAVLNRSSAWALRIAAGLGLFPRVSIRIVDTVAAAQALRREMDATAADGPTIFVQGSVYMRHYPILGGAISGRRIIA